MKQVSLSVRGVLLPLLLVGLSLTCARGAEHRSLLMEDGTSLQVRLVAPPAGGDSYPVLLALPPGDQGAEAVDWGIENLYREQAEKRGWVVVSPVAPEGRSFFRGSEKYIPELLRQLAREYPPEGGKFHLAGVSNGGLAAFRVAVLFPELFQAIAVLPGWPPYDDLERLGRIRGIPLRMWVGERENPRRVDLMKAALERLGENGSAELVLLAGEAHELDGLLGGSEIFEFFEAHRPRARD